MEFEGRKRVRQHFDIAPLIDIVFLLLIFFMLTAHFVKQPGIKIILPQATEARSQEEEDIVIFISEKNQIYLSDRQIGIEGLRDALKKRLEAVEKKVVIIRADEKINLGFAVAVMDVAKWAGAVDMVISTQKPKEK